MYGNPYTVTRGEFINYRNNRFKLQYLCGYFPSKSQPDAVSRSLLLFKNNDPLHVEAWTHYATEAITLGRDCLILRPLSCTETAIKADTRQHHPLDTLCTHLAFRNNCLYEPWLLAKQTVTRQLRGLSRDDRWQMLCDQYRLTGRIDTERVGHVLLVDDIVTTGTTFRTLIRLLKFHYPGLQISAFALGRTAEKRNNPKRRQELGYNQWFSGELPILNDGADGYRSKPPTRGKSKRVDFKNDDTFIER